MTTGAANDLQRATDIAEQMVSTYGMSDTLGPLAYDKQGSSRFLEGGTNPRRVVSDATAQSIDRDVRGLVDRGHERALFILRHNQDFLESIFKEILEKEVIEGDELKNLLATSIMPGEAVAAWPALGGSGTLWPPERESDRSFRLHGLSVAEWADPHDASTLNGLSPTSVGKKSPGVCGTSVHLPL